MYLGGDALQREARYGVLAPCEGKRLTQFKDQHAGPKSNGVDDSNDGGRVRPYADAPRPWISPQYAIGWVIRTVSPRSRCSTRGLGVNPPSRQSLLDQISVAGQLSKRIVFLVRAGNRWVRRPIGVAVEP